MLLSIYSLLLMLVAPVVWAGMYWRARRAGGNWEILCAERFGRYTQPWDGARPVWVHAVSLGETRGAATFIRGLLAQGERVLLTHMTATGRAEGVRLFAEEIAEGQLRQQWVPYDFPGATRDFFEHYNPRLGILIEREVWPNLIAQAKRSGIPMLMVNARFSPQALRHVHQIERFLGSLMRDAYTSLDLVLAQTSEDAARLFEIGVRNVLVLGNMKFDLQLPAVAIETGRDWHTGLGRPVIAIASTRDGEDELFAQALKRLLTKQTRALFFLIPRHPQRFDEAAGHLDEAGLKYARWSVIRRDSPSAQHIAELQVILADTVGEMPFFYAASDIAIVAGSFAPFGGQNLIEPCAVGTPVIVGPHTYNFKDAVQDAVAQGVAVQVTGHSDDANSVEKTAHSTTALALIQAFEWLGDPASLEQRSQKAKSWVAQHTGATKRTLEQITEFENALGQ